MALLHKAVYDMVDSPPLSLAWDGLAPGPTRPTPVVTEAEILDGIDELSVNVDMKVMYDRQYTNSWSVESNSGLGHDRSEKGSEQYSSLYKLASMINHSCIPTAHFSNLGDVSEVFPCE